MKCEPVSLNTALVRIASQLGLDPVELAEYAAEDAIGGWHADERQAKWPVGSLWAVEGQILYALVRALKPMNALELGTYHGCSATHIAAALKRNGTGWLTCVDNGFDARGQFSIGHLIPEALLDYIEMVDSDLVEFMSRDTSHGYNFIFEDGFHSPDQVQALWQTFPQRLMPMGVAVSHDACHFIVGDNVSGGIRGAGIEDAGYYLIAPADCGLAVWRNPETMPDEEKPKRKRKAKAE